MLYQWIRQTTARLFGTSPIAQRPHAAHAQFPLQREAYPGERADTVGLLVASSISAATLGFLYQRDAANQQVTENLPLDAAQGPTAIPPRTPQL